MAPSKKKSFNKKRKSAKKGNDGPAAKKPTPQPQKSAAAATKPQRSATADGRLTLKEQLEQQRQEAQEWKKKALDLESGQKDKADKVKLLKPAGEDSKVFLMLKNGLVQDVYNSFKFMHCDEDVTYVVSECLKHITDWPKIKKLSGADLDELVDCYVEV